MGYRVTVLLRKQPQSTGGVRMALDAGRASVHLM